MRRPSLVSLDIVRLVLEGRLVVTHTNASLMSLDVVLGLLGLVLIEALLRHCLPPSGRVRRITGHAQDAAAYRNLPYSSSNRQAALRSSGRAAIAGPAPGVLEGLPGGLRQPGAAPDPARLGGLDLRDVGLRARRHRVRLRAERGDGGGDRRARALECRRARFAVRRAARRPLRQAPRDGLLRP